MLFSADWYGASPIDEWKLPGMEIIIDKEKIALYQEAASKGHFLTLHSPMQVSIGSKKGNVRYMSTEVICEHLSILRQIQPNQAARIVVHAANFSERSPEEVWEVQRKTLWSLWFKMRDRHLLDNSLICIENLGKLNQVGTVSDIIRLCNLTDSFIPCIDFGHLHGRSLGTSLNSMEEFCQVFDELRAGLPAWKVNFMHIHFSKLLYTDNGEKKHTTFSDKPAGPKPGHFIRALIRQPDEFMPVIVCESPDPHKDGLALKANFDFRKKLMLK